LSPLQGVQHAIVGQADDAGADLAREDAEPFRLELMVDGEGREESAKPASAIGQTTFCGGAETDRCAVALTSVDTPPTASSGIFLPM
jgi:hypothetical protein